MLINKKIKLIMKKKYKYLILIIGLVLVTVVGYWGVGEYQFQKEKN